MPSAAQPHPPADLLHRARQLPKVLLHEHLDGGLRVATLLDLLRQRGIASPAPDAGSLSAWFDARAHAGSLDDYLRGFALTVAAMATPEALARVAFEAAEDALAEGAVLATGGKRVHVPGCESGAFIEPTIFAHVRNDMRIAREEIFGPVLAVIPYNSLTEAIEQANDSDYGLGGAVWSRDLQAAIEVAKRIRTGTVWINDYHLINPLAPFGGYKQSGIGREHGMYGMLEYTQIKHVHVDLMQTRAGRIWWDMLLPPTE